MKQCIVISVLCVVVAGCASIRKESYGDSERASTLLAEYNALDRKEQHTFMRNLTTDDLFAFTLAAIPAYARQQFKGKDVDLSDLRVEEVLGMMGGDDFEDWGEKRLADSRRLTATTIISLLEDPRLPPEWRCAFRGYIRIVFFANPGPPSVHQIGLTHQDVKALKAYLKKTNNGDPQQPDEAVTLESAPSAAP